MKSLLYASLLVVLVLHLSCSDGGDEGGIKPGDTTPPGSVSNLKARRCYGSVRLSWTAPPDSDFVGVLIRYSTSSYPISIGNGEAIENGNWGRFPGNPAEADSFTHDGLDNDTTYFYSAFAYDEVRNHADRDSVHCTPTASAQTLTEAGWALYESSQFESAIFPFLCATHAYPAYSDAYNGLGWSYVAIDTFIEALDYFNECIASGMTTADPYAGRAPIYRDMLYPTHFQDAISTAETALSKDSRYVFAHDTDFDWRDLRVILAQSYFSIGDFPNAKTEVDSLDGISLDPDSPTFIEELADEILRLESLYSDW